MMSSEKSGAQRRYRNDAPFSIYVSSRYHRLSCYYLSKILTASAKQLFCGTVDKLNHHYIKKNKKKLSYLN